MRKAQATIELTLSLIILMALLGAAIRISAWACRSTIGRHNAYVEDFKNNFNNPVEFYSPEKIELVPEE